MPEKPIDPKVAEAVRFAAEAHGRQARKGTGTPYLIHPLGVARLLDAAGCGVETVIAGILHDVIEDSRHHGEEEIRQAFGGRVAEIVVGASEPNRGNSWKARKQHTIDFIASLADLEILAVSCADKLDNMMSIRQDLEWAGDETVFWDRFNAPRSDQGWYYTRLAQAFVAQQNKSAALEFLAPRFLSAVDSVFRS